MKNPYVGDILDVHLEFPKRELCFGRLSAYPSSLDLIQVLLSALIIGKPDSPIRPLVDAWEIDALCKGDRTQTVINQQNLSSWLVGVSPRQSPYFLARSVNDFVGGNRLKFTTDCDFRYLLWRALKGSPSVVCLDRFGTVDFPDGYWVVLSGLKTPQSPILAQDTIQVDVIENLYLEAPRGQLTPKGESTKKASTIGRLRDVSFREGSRTGSIWAWTLDD